MHQAEESKQTNEEVEEQEMLAMVSEFECTDLLQNSVETATARITQCMGEVRSFWFLKTIIFFFQSNLSNELI